MPLNISLPPSPGPYILLASLPLLVLSESNHRSHPGTGLFKILSSIAFLIGPLQRIFSHSLTSFHFLDLVNPYKHYDYDRLITTGLFFSLIGDFFLIPSRSEFRPGGKGKGKGNVSVSFQLGVLAFAAAHVAYILAFWDRAASRISQGGFWGVFIMTLVLAKILGVIYPGEAGGYSVANILNLVIEEGMKPLVLGYAVIISAMFGVAVGAVIADPFAGWADQRVVGAAMFVVSDVFVARSAFGSGSGERGRVEIATGYGLYFWGQMVIAGTVGR